MREAQVMKKMKHPNLVQLIGVCSAVLPMYIVTEMVPHGDMLSYLRRPGAKKEMIPKAMLYIATQVFTATLTSVYGNFHCFGTASTVLGPLLADFLADFSAACMPSHARRVMYSTQCPCVLDCNILYLVPMLIGC